MRFLPTPLQDAYVIELEPLADSRGFFARAFCRHEFEEQGLNPDVAQCNVSFNHRRGTVRGMHFQKPPHREVKVVRCTRGAIYDVIVDIREESPTRGRWYGVELTEENRRMLYVPEGFAHGYQTLEDGSEVFYQVSEFYSPGSEGGLRWNDPSIGIEWPLPVTEISEKDRSHPDASALGLA